MKATLVILLGFLGAAHGLAEELLMTELGSYSYTQPAVTVAVTDGGDAKVAVKMSFNEPDFKGSVGTGKDDPMKVVPGKWALQFVPPHELWIHDGAGRVRLMQRTLQPSGFKNSSSDVVPELLTRAPEKLRKQMEASQRDKVKGR